MKKFVNGQYINLTEDEIAEFQRQSAILQAQEASRPLITEEVSRMLIATQINTLTVDDTTALRMTSFYPEWVTGTAYDAGFKVQFGGALYRCLTAHTSQNGWTPTAAPSLWAKVLIPDENTVPAWEQPDSTNPYMKGDRVIHNGNTWVSTVDNNVWEPGVYGWEISDA